MAMKHAKSVSTTKKLPAKKRKSVQIRFITTFDIKNSPKSASTVSSIEGVDRAGIAILSWKNDAHERVRARTRVRRRGQLISKK